MYPIGCLPIGYLWCGGYALPMNSGPQPSRRAKITAEAIVEITEEAAVIEAALAHMERGEFTVDGERETRQAEVKGDAVAAVGWLVDIFGLLQDIPGTQIVQGSDRTVEVDRYGLELSTGPDFAALFAVCRCGEDSCDACGGFQLTPRTAAVLWSMANLLADRGYDDVTEYGDAPVTDDNGWTLFGQYPRITWQQDAVWRRQAARAYDDLAEDIEAGRWPRPRCAGEEMALHLALQNAPDAVQDGWTGLDDTRPLLLEHPDDYDWAMASEVFFQDHDILDLFDVVKDGIEDPDSDLNRATGMGDYRPQAWFHTFLNMPPRDGRRTFRR
jgi:hypothetical protein